LREEKIDEVQPVVPRSSVPWAVVIEVAFTTLAPPVWLEPITKSIPSVCEEPGPPSLDFLYLDSFHQSLRREKIRSIAMRRRRATFGRRVLLAVVLLAVVLLAVIAWGFWSKKGTKADAPGGALNKEEEEETESRQSLDSSVPSGYSSSRSEPDPDLQT